MWAAMVSTKYANLVDKIYENPDVTVDEKLLDRFTWQEVKLDKTLGLHIYTKCPTSIKKLMKREKIMNSCVATQVDSRSSPTSGKRSIAEAQIASEV